MKKFNSTLAIVAIALTSVFGFTSCDKADDDVFNKPVLTSPIPSNPDFGNPNPGTQGQPGGETGTQGGDEGKSETNHQKTTDELAKKTYNIDFIGSWEYVNEDGKTFVLNVTEETETTSSYRYYAATLTIDGVEYEGEMSSALFKTIAKSTNGTSRLCALAFFDYADESTNDELVVRLTYDKKMSTQPAVFKKVEGAHSEIKGRSHFIR